MRSHDPSIVAAAVMTPSMATGGLSWCGDLLVAAIVLGGLVLGARVGLFRATVAGVLAFATLIVPLALADWLAQRLIGMDVPSRLAIGAAFFVLLAAMVTCLRRLANGLISPQAMRLPPVVDLVGGSAAGIVAGVVVAGTALIAWSILPLPPRLRIDPTAMSLDTGTAMLAAFAHCAARDPAEASMVLDGESRQEPRFPRRHRASETFVDRDANGRYDAGEEYLDVDDNHAFSPRLLFHDANGNGRRDIGLLERYRLGRWDRVVVVPAPSDEPPRPAAPVDADGEGTETAPAADSPATAP